MENIVEHLSKPLHKEGYEALKNQDWSDSSISQNKYLAESSSFRLMKPNKGRKRNIVNNAESMHDLIYSDIIPKWKNYLQFKSERGYTTAIRARSDTLWKKILRDVREFFRILFRKRFHYLEFRDFKGASKWIKILFEELGIEISEEESNNLKLFKFIHQTHKSKFEDVVDKIDSPYDVIEKYNEHYRELFMTDTTCSRMFYFVYKNFLNEYISLVKQVYRKEVVTMICLILNCYRRMKQNDHIQRICFLLN